jgi:hypothetical protein
MGVDWNAKRATVKRMIDKYGRPLTFVNDSTAADPNDPLGAPAARLEVSNVMGVFVRPSGYIKLGESTAMDPGMWPEADKIVLVLPSLEHNFELFTRVLDNAVGSGAQGYKIYKTELLKPGPIPLLLYVGLNL